MSFSSISCALKISFELWVVTGSLTVHVFWLCKQWFLFASASVNFIAWESHLSFVLCTECVAPIWTTGFDSLLHARVHLPRLYRRIELTKFVGNLVFFYTMSSFIIAVESKLCLAIFWDFMSLVKVVPKYLNITHSTKSFWILLFPALNVSIL